MNDRTHTSSPGIHGRLVLSCVMLLLPATALPAQVLLTPEGPVNPQDKRGPAAQREPETFKLEISAAPEPSPALRHRLVTPYHERTPGNAVPYYYRSVVILHESRRDELMQKYYDNEETWLEAPLAQMPRDDVRKFLEDFSTIFEQLRIATGRESVEWDWRIQDLRGTAPIQFELREIQEMRTFARLLRLKARLEIAEGRYDDAVETFRTGYALARATAEPPTMINKLVAIAIASIMHEKLRELIAAPGSPNLYWALSELPRPLVDMQEALQYEMSMPEQMFPFLKDAEMVERTPEEWQRVIREAFERLAEIEGPAGLSNGLGQARLDFLAAGLALKGYPQARRDLVEAGYDAERVEKMPVAQVVAIHQARVYRQIYHEIFKWSLLPYAEAIPRGRQAEDKLKAERYLAPPGRTREIIPIASLLLPAVFRAQEAEVRLAVRTAGLRALEAVRMQAAANGGRWPKSLDEVTVVPVPENPRNGQPFPYRVEGERAILEIPGPEGQEMIGWRFELTLRKTDAKDTARSK